jgi:hypothetical protein
MTSTEPAINLTEYKEVPTSEPVGQSSTTDQNSNYIF